MHCIAVYHDMIVWWPMYRDAYCVVKSLPLPSPIYRQLSSLKFSVLNTLCPGHKAWLLCVLNNLNFQHHQNMQSKLYSSRVSMSTVLIILENNDWQSKVKTGRQLQKQLFKKHFFFKWVGEGKQYFWIKKQTVIRMSSSALSDLKVNLCRKANVMRDDLTSRQSLHPKSQIIKIPVKKTDSAGIRPKTNVTHITIIYWGQSRFDDYIR